jgi:hypothetical protein
MELSLDIFRNDAFSVTSLQRVVDNTPYIPQALGLMQLFNPVPIQTETVLLYEEDSGIRFIPTTERGTPDIQQIRDVGRLRALSTKRLAKMDTVRASELLGVANMALPETIRLRNAQELLVRRMSKLKSEMEATKELHRFGALQGKLLDVDGTTVIYNYFTEYGVADPVLIDVDFPNIPEAQLMQFFQDTFRRPIVDSLRNRATPNVRIGCLVGDGFWAKLMTHPGFRNIYVQMSTAIAVARATNPLVQPNMWLEVDFAGITWMNYRGSTNGEIAIPYNECRFFPIGAQDVFNVYWSPGETLLDVQDVGRPEYPYIQPDVRTQMPTHVDFFLRSYPLYACIYPQALMRARVKP